MKKRFMLGQLVLLACCVSTVSADRRGGPARPNGGGNFERRDDRINWDDVEPYQNNQPSVVIAEDPKAAAEARKAEQRKKEAARKKAAKSHGDPMGGFFDENQDPKNMFNH